MDNFQLIREELFCRSDDGAASAIGHLEGHEVLVVHVDSIVKGHPLLNDRFLDQEVVRRDRDGFRFIVNFPFPSPRAASMYVLGDGKPVGCDIWKNSAGKTLRQLFSNAGWLWLIEGKTAQPS